MATTALQWIPYPDERIETRGLAWFRENSPELCRMPREALNGLPEGVRNQAHFPSGARLRFRSTTSRLSLQVQALSPSPGHGVDIYVNGAYWLSSLIRQQEQTVQCFDTSDTTEKEITLYLPYRQAARVLAIGIDFDATPAPAEPLKGRGPLVLYGSSIAQGVGASRPSMSYMSILARRRNLDFIDLGFGGAGKAEPEVVDLLSKVEGSCFLFDLGKSYGMQPEGPFAAMLETVRVAHPGAPMVCITPIFSTCELFSPQLGTLSQHTRDVMRAVAAERVRSEGDKFTLIEGLDLLGSADTDAFTADGVHPNDYGHALLAERLEARLEGMLSGL